MPRHDVPLTARVIAGIHEVDLICPACTAANAPNRTVIELQRDGTAVCGCCSKQWTPKETR